MNYLRWPLERHEVTQEFGVDFRDPKTGKLVYASMGLKAHNGVDFRTRYFSLDGILGHGKCLAARDGQIETVRFDKGGYGTHIRLRHTDGGLTIYGHLSKVLVTVGQRVVEGEQIGVTGNTGLSSAPHLHFEYRPKDLDVNNGYFGAVDPMPLLLNYQAMVDEQKKAVDTAKAEADEAFSELGKEGIMKRVNEEGAINRREIALVTYRLMKWVVKFVNKATNEALKK